MLRHLLAAAEADLGAPIRRAVISASVWHAELHNGMQHITLVLLCNTECIRSGSVTRFIL